MQSDCGVHGNLAQAGVPGLFPPNHPFQEIKQPTIHWVSIWLPFLPSKSALKQNTRQPVGPRAEILPGSLPSATPAWMMLTVLLPSPPPLPPQSLGYPLSTLPWIILLPSSPTHQQLRSGWNPSQAPPSATSYLHRSILLTSSLLWPLPPPFTFLLKSP